jgi:hypothetical protein
MDNLARLPRPEIRQEQAARQPNGRFVRGAPSPNPGGRPKLIGHVRDLARAHTELAIDTLARIAADEAQPGAARVGAAIAILDRGYGRPAQAVAIVDAPSVEQRMDLIEAFQAAAAGAMGKLAAQEELNARLQRCAATDSPSQADGPGEHDA